MINWSEANDSELVCYCIEVDKKGPFIILCHLGKIKNTKGHKDENRNRCRAIC